MDTSDSIDYDSISMRVTELLQAHRDKIKEDKLSARRIRNMQGKLADDAAVSYRTQDFETALSLFCNYLACIEAAGSKDKETLAAIVSNIGSCLHNLEDFEAAEGYYKAAITLFEQIKTGTLTWVLYGDVNSKRLEYVKARVGELSQKQRPDLQKYLDGNGREQKWTKSEMTPGMPQWSWYNPYTWYQWYFYQPLADNSTVPTPVTNA